MSTWMPWKIALKEMKVLRRKKSVIYYIVALPLILSVFFRSSSRTRSPNRLG